MKNYRLLFILFLLSVALSAHAQRGDDMSYPIEAGTFYSDFKYSDTQDTREFSNAYEGTPSYDVFYKFTIRSRMKVVIQLCDSEVVDTYISLLDNKGNLIAYNADASSSVMCGNNEGEAYLSKVLDPGTYYAVVEAEEEYDAGNITTQITGVTIPSEGDSKQQAINVGTYGSNFDYSDTRDMSLYSCQFNSDEKEDVFYKFTLTRKMVVTITHCGSKVYDTYAYLLDAAGNVMNFNNTYEGDGSCASGIPHAFIQCNLEAGTYYIVSKGFDPQRLLTTNVNGFAPEEFDYLDYPVAYSTEPQKVMSAGGNLEVSASGAAVYSIPIKVPQGVGGMQPSLAIVYNSQSGNGMAGWGCNLSGISAITRGAKDIYHDGTAQALTFSTDGAYYLDGKRLIHSSGTVGQDGCVYSPESAPFTKVTLHGTSATSLWFEVETADGQTCYYGQTANARQNHTNPSGIFAWYLNRVIDPRGNYMDYTYSNRNNCMYPDVITYGNNLNGNTGLTNTVTFNYETRPYDPQPFAIAGMTGTMDRRLRSITSKTGDNVFRNYILQYDLYSKFSRLRKITEKNGAGEVSRPIELYWTEFPNIQNAPVTPVVNATNYSNDIDFSQKHFTAGDFNGDGLTDILGISPARRQTITGATYDITLARIYWASLDSSGNVQFTTGSDYDLDNNFIVKNIKEYNIGSSVLDFNGDGSYEFLVPYVSITDFNKDVTFIICGSGVSERHKYELKCSSEMVVYAVGDFNNDGKGNVVFIEKGHNNNQYPSGIMGYNSSSTAYHKAFNLNLPSKPEKIFVSDFNANGLEDMMVVYNGGYSIYWNQGNGITSTTFSDANKTTGTNVYNVWMMRSGDFNGDGLPDLLMNATGDNAWYFALNNGNGTFTRTQACTLEICDQNFTKKDDDKFDCCIFDFDYDGKSDVVITKAMYKKRSAIFQGEWGEFTKTYTYWLHSTGTSLTSQRSSTSNKEEDALSSRYIVGDFNGDGQMELMNYGYNCYSSTNANTDPVWRLYKDRYYSPRDGKLHTVTDNYGGTTYLSYASLANGGIYTKGTGGSYPAIDCILPLHVVESISTENGAAGSMRTDYRYKGLKVHLQGKGMLGMSSVTAENTTTGTTSESGIAAWNSTFCVPSSTYTKNTVDGSTAESTTTLTFVDKGSKQYFVYPSTTTEKDLDGNTTTTTRQFDTTHGYLTQERTDYNANMYRTVQYGNYVLAGKVYQPQLVTKVQKHEDDDAAFTQKTQITYDTSYGYKTKTVENFGTTLPLTTDFTYDTWGNVLTEKASGSGVTVLTQKYDYDATKRFVVKAYTNPVSSVTTYTYDIWGNVLTETDESDASNKLTTTYTYDGWGDKISTVLPDGTKQTYLKGWNTNPGKRFFVLTQGTGQPWVKTWYDNQGREVIVESIGPKGLSVKETTSYNKKGQVSRKSSRTGNLTTTENYTYDERGRILTQTNSTGRNISYAYGNRTVSTTTNGHIHTKTYDAWGGVKSVTDPVSTIDYTYKSVGQPKEIVTGGATFSMTYYDDTGKQKTLTDPNAGTLTYTYDAAGRVKTHVDGKGRTTTNTYDNLGRLTKSVTDGVTTEYTYGTSGNGYLRLVKEQTGNNYTAYTYDNYGRMQTETRQVEGTGALVFTYTYNQQGQLGSIAYPGALTVSRNYDAYGNLVKLTAGTQAVWELTDITGTVTTTKLGGTLTATETRNSQGLLSNLKTVKGSTVLHNMDYVFNGATGNLTSRTGMLPQMESFVYDDMDRLTTVKQGSSTVMTMSYQANGNIASKTGLGTYSYEKPYAVSGVDNTGGLISGNEQNITYNVFNKVASVSETVGSNNYLLNITYGPDRQRWKSTLKTNNAVTRTIVYAGDYETVTEDGVTKQLYYLSGDNGLTAIYVKQSGQPDKIYYAHKDHLGSIVKLTDNAGTEIFKASYDAWGRRTVANSTFKFHRGYTGHEHLDEFKLIDMNGRMYDPLLARFLSPDPFVQMPDFSQNFNRYTYCLNNPLIYTDPSGEVFLIDDIILAACMGAMMNVCIQGMSGNINNAGDFFGAMGIGVLSGTIGSFAGQAVAGSLGTTTTFGGSITNGFITGASVGFTSGFIGSAGNAWVDGASLGTGIKQSLIGAGIGAVIGGSIGAISKGVQYKKQYSIFAKGNTTLGVNEGDPVPATNDFLLKAQRAWYKDAPMDNIDVFSIENIPEKRLKSLDASNARAVTVTKSVGGKFTGRSSVYFHPVRAVSSAKQLFLTMGHELMHVSQYTTLIGQSSSLMSSKGFQNMLDYYAYSYEAILGGSNLNSFSQEEISMWAKMYPRQYNVMSYFKYPWALNHSFKYPF